MLFSGSIFQAPGPLTATRGFRVSGRVWRVRSGGGAGVGRVSGGVLVGFESGIGVGWHRCVGDAGRSEACRPEARMKEFLW
ncbi:hypothetical protein Slala03_58130 [Streptomyces lavendulae subsp. lavendulae]|nr:hypothetical protein Slala03_58130 [Streptomyces lavendulae subsp. lavendulae]